MTELMALMLVSIELARFDCLVVVVVALVGIKMEEELALDDDDESLETSKSSNKFFASFLTSAGGVELTLTDSDKMLNASSSAL